MQPCLPESAASSALKRPRSRVARAVRPPGQVTSEGMPTPDLCGVGRIFAGEPIDLLLVGPRQVRPLGRIVGPGKAGFKIDLLVDERRHRVGVLHDGVPQLIVGQLNLYVRTQHDNYPHKTLQS